MSFLIATPELVTAAATDLANIGSTLEHGQHGRGGHDHGGAGRGRR